MLAVDRGGILRPLSVDLGSLASWLGYLAFTVKFTVPTQGDIPFVTVGGKRQGCYLQLLFVKFGTF